MRPLSDMINRTGTENAFAVGPQITAIEAQGYNITKLSIGEPGGNIPDVATAAAIKSLQEHETHYTPAQGQLALREGIAELMRATHQVPYGPEHIVLTPGGKPVILGMMSLVINPLSLIHI